jgi:hypothetical protein
VPFNRRLDRLEQWAGQNVVKWSEVEDFFRTTLTLFDQALALHMNDADRGEFGGEMVRVMLQKARENGALP